MCPTRRRTYLGVLVVYEVELRRNVGTVLRRVLPVGRRRRAQQLARDVRSVRQEAAVEVLRRVLTTKGAGASPESASCRQTAGGLADAIATGIRHHLAPAEAQNFHVQQQRRRQQQRRWRRQQQQR